MKVRYKKNAPRIRRNTEKRKVHFSTVAATFKTYNDSLSKADLLFDVFSPERMEAQRTALDKLQERMNNLNMRRFIQHLDFESCYQFPTRYAA